MLSKPTVFKSIGMPFTRKGVQLVAARRPPGLQPSEACRGCFYKEVCNSQLACSRFDRVDGVSIWFQEIKTK